MMDGAMVSGIDLTSLHEAFEGSEDVLEQMLGLFLVQAAERMAQLDAHLAAWDVMAARAVLHSLINISGAVRAYAMSDLTKSVGDAVKREDRSQALAAARALGREAETVLAQARVLVQAAKAGPAAIWSAALPGLGG
ncbi:MAG: Hpt domain-containing protein [Desulfovibrio sp.]|nr:Hpt domain-containing protein [Desulfovibrio sp.]